MKNKKLENKNKKENKESKSKSKKKELKYFNRKINRGYLDDLGEKYESSRDCEILAPESRERLYKQYLKYGFDERDTWSLDHTMLEMLYERLKMYKEITGDLLELNDHNIQYMGKSYSQEEVLDMLIDYAKTILSYRYGFTGGYSYEVDFWNLWAKTYMYFWW